MLRAALYMFVRYLMASGSRFLRCLMFMPSGPVEFLFVPFQLYIFQTFPNIHTQKVLKRSSALQTPSTSRKLPIVRMQKIDKIQEFAKRDKISTFDNLNASHAIRILLP